MTIERERQITSVRVDGAELAVFVSGNPTGPTLVLVHGWPDTHHLWDGVASRLADRFRLVSYDTRGHGRSTGTGTVAEMRLEQLADDFMAVVDAVAGSTPVHVLAHDWGSIQVWEAICEPGAEVRVASFTSISGPSLDHLGKWMRQAPSTPKGLWQLFTQLVSGAYTLFFMAGALPRAVFRVFGRRWTWALGLRLFERVPGRHIHLADTLQQDMIRGLRIYRANIPRKILRPDERYTHVPVQLLVPSRDPAVRPASFAGIDRWVADVSRTDVRSGHWLPLKDPELVATATASFVERNSK
ncbi:alpha/beta fold hydrolase [Rhodococcus sp. BP-252]|uniref:AB hydrolase-1 domain-containing protein n=1 Tax=Rhodococcoides kyotonense TaxID=398843 RepID=A0A177Y8F1_9NOCA|nr:MULTISPECIES: alpha/beta fold hydrolase [Rhodococcus]MBY6411995.1 alpha/beta fold hydrolase [Rhodococcus sp. BP-320]MBY6416377.1 alpha/beta fold hydrolase [Rhodococcus sp. BP-321]MBY6420817.1 alpha/beta fold hydrolase [Rhodococcus sp. BP-324]MBY6426401.1 alpha/beta fold hydrolase [Rhodococcus sp. BP-323]MBY6431400.1 alpha/beta fold hydrolase [Rhodococcus sp. BP-322]